MSRVASRMGAGEADPEESPLKDTERRRLSRAARIYDAARVLAALRETKSRSGCQSPSGRPLSSEVKAFNGLERRRILHLPMSAGTNARSSGGWRATENTAAYSIGRIKYHCQGPSQVFFCIDEREESMRRALEETDPSVETFSSPDTSASPWTTKESMTRMARRFARWWSSPSTPSWNSQRPEDSALLESRRWRRRILGLLMRNSLVSSKTLLRGWLSTSVLGLLSAVPLVGTSAGASALCTSARLAE